MWFYSQAVNSVLIVLKKIRSSHFVSLKYINRDVCDAWNGIKRRKSDAIVSNLSKMSFLFMSGCVISFVQISEWHQPGQKIIIANIL